MNTPSTTQDVNDLEMVRVSCPLCGGTRYKTLYKPWNINVDPRQVLSASGGVRGTQYIVKCDDCHLIYANPRPRPDIVVNSYAASVDEIYVGAGATRETTFRRCVQTVEKYAKRGKMLDVGAAAGFFVKAAHDLGWDALGVEPSRWLAEYGSSKLGVNIIPATLQAASFPDNSFDVVTMWDVLEHVPDPVDDLRETLRILRPGGMLLANFPDAGTWLARLAGNNWWFFLSVHLTYFTQSTLKKMLLKVGFVGFKSYPHYQVLNLGHLMKMGALYAPGLSNVFGKIVDGLHWGNVPIPYYASQTTTIVFKPGQQATR